MSQFYITLPSDASSDVYPDNTVANYTTKLSQRIHLNGEYEVALADSWINFNETGMTCVLSKKKARLTNGVYSPPHILTMRKN